MRICSWKRRDVGRKSSRSWQFQMITSTSNWFANCQGLIIDWTDRRVQNKVPLQNINYFDFIISVRQRVNGEEKYLLFVPPLLVGRIICRISCGLRKYREIFCAVNFAVEEYPNTVLKLSERLFCGAISITTMDEWLVEYLLWPCPALCSDRTNLPTTATFLFWSEQLFSSHWSMSVYQQCTVYFLFGWLARQLQRCWSWELELNVVIIIIICCFHSHRHSVH